ncbi:IBR domain, a half RING-finger domain-containing protein [Ditylenchus destructor]|nr:IBR domain, a half RING-finger domain-containing protein [Ditylenchus destructor]
MSDDENYDYAESHEEEMSSVVSSDEELDEVEDDRAKSGEPYEILNRDQLVAEMNRVTEEIASVINYPKSACRVLLHRFHWHKEEVLEKFCEMPSLNELVGASATKDNSELAEENRSFGYCSICDDTITKPLVSLACNHLFCYECWDSHLSTKVKADGLSYITCMEYKCTSIIDDDLAISLIIDPDVKISYSKLVTNGFVKSNRYMKFCPGKGCERAIRVNDLGCRMIFCKCKHVWCFECTEEWHEPVNCELLKKWLKQCSDDSETYNWINAYTKDCPKCKTAIEKNGGCNHMTCRSTACKYEFCWICMEDWKKHNSNYSCNRYSDDLYDAVEEKMKVMQNHEFTFVETKFFTKAVDILGICRRTLMYTYAFAFYLVQGNNMTQLFEDNQQDLELATEKLSGYLENELEINDELDLNELKRNVQDKASYVDQRRTILVKMTDEGVENDSWKFNQEVFIGSTTGTTK